MEGSEILFDGSSGERLNSSEANRLGQNQEDHIRREVEFIGEKEATKYQNKPHYLLLLIFSESYLILEILISGDPCRSQARKQRDYFSGQLCTCIHAHGVLREAAGHREKKEI